MAASRKLQGEIDRCLKKVTEGVETFEDIWSKVTHATNSNQKEKYEADLKKEIKKLQRLRDQIKTWQASAEVKDKSSLIEHRKLIETQMERFKGLERETKTKAYSKEGLGAATKLDPVQKERDECTRWLSNNIEQLNVQIDQFEAQMDGITVKRKRDKDKSERLDQLKHWIERHRFHIKKLETLLRMLDNNAVDIESVKKIREDVEYYTESNQDDDGFIENEFLYDDINMDSVEEMWSDVVGVADGTTRGDELSETPTNSLHSGSSPSPLNNNHSAGGDSHPAEAEAKTSSSRTGRRSVSRSVSEDSTSTTQKTKHSSGSAVKALQNATPVSASKTATAAAAAAAAASAGSPSGASSGSVRSQSTPLAPAGGSGAVSATSPNFAAVAAASQQPTASSVHILTTTTPASASTTVSTAAAAAAAAAPSSPAPPAAAPSAAPAPPAQPPPPAPSPAAARQPAAAAQQQAAAAAAAAAQLRQDAAQQAQQQAQQQQQQQAAQQTAVQQVNGEKSSDSAALKLLSQQLQGRASPADVSKSAAPTNEANIPVLFSVAPLGPVPMTKEHDYQYQMLQAAFYHMPHPSDSERLRSYLPRNPYPTPAYYPQVPPPGSDSIEFFLKLSVETLFFIFYYMEGTKAQYLAAKALKKQSWRFHTKYMMWFQRHEEPKVITDEFEQGTYVYFDFEKWSQRKKEGFKFEYKFLEDRDLN